MPRLFFGSTHDRPRRRPRQQWAEATANARTYTSVVPNPRPLVATGHPDVTAAARDVLLAGGNAFDAAVSAGFASTVAEPTLSSLGGGGFLLAHRPAGRDVVFDFFVDTPGRGRGPASEPHFEPVGVRFPGADQEFHVGLGAAAVPGCLAGLLRVHEALGRMPLGAVVAPAIALARNGLTVSPFQGYVMDLLRPILTLSRDIRALFAPGGRPLKAGDRFENRALADFLDALPESADAFYRGSIATALEQQMDDADGLLTRADLEAYRVIERRPLAVEFRGRRLLTNPAPSVGGRMIARGLAWLEEARLGTFGSPHHVRTLAEAFSKLEQLRVDPDGLPEFPRGTTHISVMDAAGNAASLSLSNGEGCGYLVPGTGVVLNNMLGEDDLHPGGFHRDPPGIRIGSMMAPTLVLDDDRPVLALGSGGSKRIRTAIVQALVNVLAFDMPLESAIHAPRMHLDTRLEVEPGFSDAALADVHRYDPNVWSERSLYFGGVHAVASPDAAVGDARRGGDAWVGPEHVATEA